MQERNTETLTVIVPCLNEEENIRGTVEDVLSYRDDLPVRLRMILVDDGSTDRTSAVMADISARHDEVRVRVNPRNLGVGRSVMNAYEDIPDGSWVTVIPGDNEFHFASIHNFLALRDRYDLVLGYVQNSVIRPLHRRVASFAFAMSVRTIYGLPYRYVNGMKLYKVDVFRGIEVLASGHAYNAELIAKAILRNPFLRVAEVPFVARGRTAGNSKAFTPRSVVRAVGEFSRGRSSVSEFRRNTIGIKD